MENKFQNWLKMIPEDIRTEVLAKLQKCTDKEGILALAAEYKLPVTEEIAEALEQLLNEPKILSEKDLSLIAGGTFNGPTAFPQATNNTAGGSGC